MTYWEERWCLVTGAASGIGRATAQLLSAKGAQLILADIQQVEVDVFARELRGAGGKALSYAVDVANLEHMQQFENWVRRTVGQVDVLINNAGVLCVGGYNDTSFEDFHRVFDVNLWGVLHATKLFAPAMVARGTGAIVNLASASGEVGFSKLTAYSTSKFAVVGFSQALQAELAGSGVSVSTICPGLVRTQIAEGPSFGDDQRSAIAEALDRGGIEAIDVANAIETAARSGQGLVHVGRDAKVLSFLSRLSPDRASSWLTRFANRR